jgi:hypothetical protein
MIQRTIPVTAAGGAGTSTGSARIGVPPGKLLGIAIDYSAGAAATTDVTVTCDPGVGGAKTLYTRTSSATDLPLQPLVDNAFEADGSASESPLEAGMLITGTVLVDVAEANNGDTVTVLLLLEG